MLPTLWVHKVSDAAPLNSDVIGLPQLWFQPSDPMSVTFDNVGSLSRLSSKDGTFPLEAFGGIRRVGNMMQLNGSQFLFATHAIAFNDFVIFAVIRPNQTLQRQVVLSSFEMGSTVGVEIAVDRVGVLRVTVGTMGPFNAFSSLVNTTSVITVMLASSSISIYVNFTLEIRKPLSQTIMHSNWFSIGAQPTLTTDSGYNNHFIGLIGDVLIFNTSLSTTELFAVQRFLCLQFTGCSSVVGSIRFSQSAYQAFEDRGTSTVAIERYGGIDGLLLVSFSAQSGTALAGTDFLDERRTLIFRHGSSATQFINISLLNDAMARSKTIFLVADVTYAAFEASSSSILSSRATVFVSDSKMFKE